MSMIEVDHHSSGDLGVLSELMISVPSHWHTFAKLLVSYDVLPGELIDLALRIAELGKDIVGVRSQPGWRHAWPRIAARKPEACTYDLNRATDAGGPFEISQELALDNLRMVENSRHAKHLASRHTMLVEDHGPVA